MAEINGRSWMRRGGEGGHHPWALVVGEERHAALEVGAEEATVLVVGAGYFGRETSAGQR
jgi:hypothetical protein